MFLSGLIGYFLGSIPFSYLVPKLMKGIDIRTVGSGNVGSTNVYRACGWTGAIAAFIGDIAKGMVAFYLAYRLFSYQAALVAGFFALVGHCYPYILGFKGGKGVSTAAGIVLMSNPLIFGMMFIVEVGLIGTTKIVSLSSILASVALPLIALMVKADTTYVYFCLAMSLFVIYRHHSNIGRLLAGTENRFGSKKQSHV